LWYRIETDIDRSLAELVRAVRVAAAALAIGITAAVLLLLLL